MWRPLVLAILGVLLWAAPPPSAHAQDVAVATVDGKPITEADLALAEREMPLASELEREDRRRVLLEALIQRQVLANAAAAAKLAEGKDFESRLAYARRALEQQALLDKHMRDAATTAEARRIYDSQAPAMKPEPEVRIGHILVDSEAVAKVVRANVIGGADFAALARALSIDQASALEGGELGWKSRRQLSNKLAQAVFALERPGALTQPVETEAGWHVVRLEERRMSTLPEFSVLEPHIKRSLARRKGQELIANLREKAKVVYLDPSLELPPSAATGPATGTAAAAASGQVAGSAPPARGSEAAVRPARPSPEPVQAARPAPATVAAGTVSPWFHKAARVKLAASGDQIEIAFETPTEALVKAGAQAGAVIFRGTRSGQSYGGEAFAFAPRCPPQPFPVTGSAAPDHKRLELRGKAPVLDAACMVTGTRDELLVFRAIGG